MPSKALLSCLKKVIISLGDVLVIVCFVCQCYVEEESPKPLQSVNLQSVPVSQLSKLDMWSTHCCWCICRLSTFSA